MKKLLVLQEINPEFLMPLFDNLTISRDADTSCVVFGGGTDVSPDLYGEKRDFRTQVPDSRRDAKEVEIFKWALDKGIPMIGICRGAQLLTALSGGKLIQHVNGHAGAHGIHQMTTETGHVMPINSYHHQMMFPNLLPEADWKLLGWAQRRLSDVYVGYNSEFVFHNWGLPANFLEGFKEPEIVWYPKTKCLCIQGHPEWVSPKHEYVRTCLQYVKEYIFGDVEKRIISS